MTSEVDMDDVAPYLLDLLLPQVPADTIISGGTHHIHLAGPTQPDGQFPTAACWAHRTWCDGRVVVRWRVVAPGRDGTRADLTTEEAVRLLAALIRPDRL